MNQAPGEAAVLLGASSLSILKLNKGQIHKSIRGWGRFFFTMALKTVIHHIIRGVKQMLN
jgi:hypothetical protein